MRKRLIYTYIILTVLLLAIRTLFLSQSGEDMRILRDGVNSLNSNWIYTYGNNQEVIDNLPVKKNVGAYESYSISKVLGGDFRERQYILIRSSLSSVTVRLEGKEIYVGQNFSKEARKTPLASAWNIVELPSNSHGKTVSIEMASPYEKISGIINEVYYSSYDGLISFISRKYMLRTVMSTVVFLMGVSITVMPIFTEKSRDSGIIYIGIFSIAISLWLFGESRTSQFYSNSQFFIGAISYMMLTLFPIPMLIYLRDYVVKRVKLPYSILIAIFSINAISILSLQLLGIRDFFETVWITQLIILLSFLVGTVTLAYEIRQLDNRAAVLFSKYFIILMVFGILEIIKFGSNNYQSTGMFIIVGIIGFMAIQLINYISHIIRLIKRSYKAELYERLALEDKMTGAKNRMAFENDIEELFKKPSRLKNLRVVFFDLNNLKHINDTYGHGEGDFAIKKAYGCIESAFGEIGDCYRLGGDEYSVIIENSDRDIYEQKKKALEECVRGEDGELQFELSIAIGSAVYDTQLDKEPKSLIGRADESMYMDKRRQKDVDNL